MRVTRPFESKLPAGVADVANIDVADDHIKVEANGVYFEVRPTAAAVFVVVHRVRARRMPVGNAVSYSQGQSRHERV